PLSRLGPDLDDQARRSRGLRMLPRFLARPLDRGHPQPRAPGAGHRLHDRRAQPRADPGRARKPDRGGARRPHRGAAGRAGGALSAPAAAMSLDSARPAWWRGRGLRVKLFGAFGLVASLGIVGAGLGYLAFLRVDAQQASILSEAVPAMLE